MSTIEKIIELQKQLEENKKKIRQAQKDEVKNMLNGKILRMKAQINKNKAVVRIPLDVAKGYLAAVRSAGKIWLHGMEGILASTIELARYIKGATAEGCSKNVETPHKTHQAIKVGEGNAKIIRRMYK